MLLFLLKNRRLRVQLMLWLLLVFGTIPQGTEGLECYSCRIDWRTGALEKRNCDIVSLCNIYDKQFGIPADSVWACSNLAIERKYSRSGVLGQIGQCVPKEAFSNCLVKVYASQNGICATIPPEDLVSPTGDPEGRDTPHALKMVNCTQGAGSRPPKMVEGRQTGNWTNEAVAEQCLCDTDLCNFKHQPTEPTSSSNWIHPSSIFAILTVGFYNYLKELW